MTPWAFEKCNKVEKAPLLKKHSTSKATGQGDRRPATAAGLPPRSTTLIIPPTAGKAASVCHVAPRFRLETTNTLTPTSLKEAWGVWADQVGDRKGGWDWFTTLTFRDRTPAEVHQGWSKVGWAYSTKALDAFLCHLGELKGLQDIHWLRAREIQHYRGVPHWHALIGGVATLRRMDLVDWWHGQGYGFARVLPYDRSLGASFYLCKYVTKELGDVEFSLNLRGLTT